MVFDKLQISFFILLMLGLMVSLEAQTTPLTQKQIHEINNNLKNAKPASNLSQKDRYIFQTSLGNIVIQIYPELAPQTCNNFNRLVLAGYYNGTLFHRVVPNYIVQGGDILSRDLDPSNDGSGSPGYSIPLEINRVCHRFGVISMARGVAAQSSGSQFFFVLNDAPELDGKYAVFGSVVQGLDVLRKIEKVALTYSTYNERSRPIEPVVLYKIEYIPEKKADKKLQKTK